MRLQESRQKRDQFLNQMSSFLEGIESNTVDVVPPEPPASFPSAGGGATAASSPAQPTRPSAESTRAEKVAGKQSLWPSAAKERPFVAPAGTFADSRKSVPRNSTAYNAGAGSSLMQEDLSGEIKLGPGAHNAFGAFVPCTGLRSGPFECWVVGPSGAGYRCAYG